VNNNDKKREEQAGFRARGEYGLLLVIQVVQSSGKDIKKSLR
jgi:hypothetical protein